MFFFPNHDIEAYTKLSNDSRFEEIKINYGKNQYLYGWFKHNTNNTPAPLIIFFGGNAQSSAETLWYLKDDVARYYEGYNFLMMDYPGYGLSTGRPNDRRMFASALTIYDYIINREDVDENNIVVMGNSIGSGVAVHLAAKREINGLILIAPYDRGLSLYNSVLNIFHGPLTILARYKFDAATYAKEVDVAPLIIASYDDEIINYQLSKNLAEHFDNIYKLFMLNNFGHNHMLTSRIVLEEINKYLLMLREI